MTELKRIHISEIATLYEVQDNPEAYYYDAKEADRKMLELELEIEELKSEIKYKEWQHEFTHNMFSANITKRQYEELKSNAVEIRKKLEAMK